jgi:hypothetical protein
MKKSVYFLLIILLIGCSTQKGQSYYYNEPEPEILLERENILKLLIENENNELNINNLFETNKLKKHEQEVDISQCIKVKTRFFVNGTENNLNDTVYYTINYYDKNRNRVLRILTNEKGGVQVQDVYKYNEKNEMIGYSSLSGPFGIIVKTTENDRITFLTIEKIYLNEYNLIEKKVYNINGDLLSEIKFYGDGFSYWIYNDKNDVIFYGYNNEKTDGPREEKYSIEYDSNFNKKRIEAYENGNLVYEIINSYNKKNLLQQSIKIFHLSNKSQKTLYTYDDRNNLLEEKVLDDNDKEIIVEYYQYDNENRIIKEGEKRANYERYWLYEYSKVDANENHLYYLNDDIIEGIRIRPIILNIADYIFNDLKLKWHYDNLDELLVSLNLSKNHIIKTRTSKNRHDPDTNDYFYNIEGGLYKLSVFYNETVGYYLLSIEIEINKNNYLNLFPYKTFNDYLPENNFNEGYKENEGRIMYGKDGDDFGACFLNFNNNILTSIEIYNGID